MKKVLIISYYFLDRSVVGSVRPGGLARFLPSFGWEPAILTAKPRRTSKSRSRQEDIDLSNLIVIDTPHEDDPFVRWKKRFGLKADETAVQQLRFGGNGNGSSNGNGFKHSLNAFSESLLNFCGEMLIFPDERVGWYSLALDKGRDILSGGDFDAIISTSSPVTSHLVARSLKDEFGIPWIADLRDLWSQNYLPRSLIAKIMDRRLEMKTLSSADSLTTVSEPLAERLRELHRGKKVYSILNGFDPDLVNPGTGLTGDFSITYTGAMYKGKRDPVPLLKALRELSQEGAIDLSDVSVHLYGDKMDWLDGDIAGFDLTETVKVHGLVSRDQSIEKQRESQILLLLNWSDPRETGVYTGKIFDYLSAQRPILSIGTSPGVVGELLRETQSGWHASSVDEIKLILKKAYDEFKSRGSVGYSGSLRLIDRYSHREMARNFCKVLSTLDV